MALLVGGTELANICSAVLRYTPCSRPVVAALGKTLLVGRASFSEFSPGSRTVTADFTTHDITVLAAALLVGGTELAGFTASVLRYTPCSRPVVAALRDTLEVLYTTCAQLLDKTV
jgi:hypothetical protein